LVKSFPMLLFSLLSILLSNAVALRWDKSILYNRLSIAILLAIIYTGLDGLNMVAMSRGLSLFGGLFHTTATSQVLQIYIFAVTAAILQLTGFYPRKVLNDKLTSTFSFIYAIFSSRNLHTASLDSEVINKKGENYKIIEYPLILLFIISGATFLISSSDIVSIFLSIELQSYGLYLLATLYRNSELSTGAGLTYFLLGGLSSCFILLGTSLLYANSGTTSLEGFYVITSLSDITKDNFTNLISLYETNYINFALIIMTAGFLFKVSAAPFHFWSPDVYDAIPTIVTTFVAIVAKISILIFLLEIVHYTSNTCFTPNFNWTYILLVSSLLSLLIGTILGLSQDRIKRLFAYSTISHLGFILLALTINSIESIQAFIFYLMQYSLSNLNAFILLLSIGYTLYTYVSDGKSHVKLLDQNNSPLQLISQLKGYFSVSPVLALSFAITIYSFVGIPPLVGFFAKQMVLSAALDNGYIFLALVAILTSVISAVYYLSVIKQVFLDKFIYTDVTETSEKALSPLNTKLSSTLSITISVLTLVILFFIFNPQEWLSMANILALLIFNP